jgi:hypothetical protein
MLKAMGIYSLENKECGCKVRYYVGGKVILIGCNNPHKNEVYYVCPNSTCKKEFHGLRNGWVNGKKELKEHLWSHAL